MTRHVTATGEPVPEPRSAAATPLRPALLWCGVVAGPLFLVVVLGQIFAREGFEPARHPLSLLSLGGTGWIQIVNFVVAGLLFTATAVGMRSALRGGRGGTWAPRLVGVFGVSLIGGGAFVADPAFGFPPGTVPGAPEQLTWHGMVHGVFPAVGFLALVVACFVLARRFAADGRRGWAAYSTVTGVLVLPLSVWPNLGGDPEGRFMPLWVALVLGLGWLSAAAARLATGTAGVRKVDS